MGFLAHHPRLNTDFLIPITQDDIQWVSTVMIVQKVYISTHSDWLEFGCQLF